MKKGWKLLLFLIVPAFLFSCASKKQSYGYKVLPPKVKVKKNDGYEEVIVIQKDEYYEEELPVYYKKSGKKLGIKIKNDRDIKRFIYFYAVKHKKYTQKVLERADLYLPMIKAIFKRYNLPLDLAYLPFIESGFDPYATSISGAAGLWQFVKGTGRKFGLKINRYVDERRDPYKSTVAAAKYLKYLYKIFGRWDLAIAAYNCGEGCVLNRMHYGADDFWDIKYSLPAQTREYVPRFIASLIIIKNPKKFGLYPIKSKPIKIKKKVALSNISLRKVSYIYDIDYSLLKAYNAHFRKGIVIKGYNLYIPTETSFKYIPRKVSYKKQKSYIKHRVKKGETLYRISKMYGVSIETIKRLNNITGNNIKVGQELKIPNREIAYE